MNPYPLEIASDQKGNVIWVRLNNNEVWELRGECLRCGQCCSGNGCKSYSTEILNGIEVGKCLENWAKPWQCKIFPTNPYDLKEKFDNCGYSWERIS